MFSTERRPYPISRSLLRDCKFFANLHLTFVSSSTAYHIYILPILSRDMFLISSHSLCAANSVHTGWDLGTDWRSLQWNVMWLFPLGLMSTSWLHFTLMAWTRRSRHGRQGSPLPARTPHSLIEGCFDSGSRSTLLHAPCEPGSPPYRAVLGFSRNFAI